MHEKPNTKSSSIFHFLCINLIRKKDIYNVLRLMPNPKFKTMCLGMSYVGSENVFVLVVNYD